MNVMLEEARRVASILTRVLIAPTSNLKLAFLLYGTLALLLILILIVGLMFVLSAPDDQPAAKAHAARRKPARARPPASRGGRKNTHHGGRTRSPKSPTARLFIGLAIAAATVAVWLTAGYTTSEPTFCESCHRSGAVHAQAKKGTDPHMNTACVSCHESGGVIGRYATGVPTRMLHLVAASFGAGRKTEYGQVTTRACSSCHASSLSGTTTSSDRGLKMSHAEPLAASAGCLDCHTMNNGAVGVHNAGMKPCLRCHDDVKVSSACDTCHVGTVAAATRASTTSFKKAQIAEVSCGGCHNEKRDCDSCHGVRMPHTTAFMNGGHARAAAVDAWYNGGKTCAKCHTATRRPCTQCHSSLIGKAHGVGLAGAHKSASSASCNTCHLQYAPIKTRDFCKDVCHTPAQIAASPR
jgi:hypothetical protein